MFILVLSLYVLPSVPCMWSSCIGVCLAQSQRSCFLFYFGDLSPRVHCALFCFLGLMQFCCVSTCVSVTFPSCSQVFIFSHFFSSFGFSFATGFSVSSCILSLSLFCTLSSTFCFWLQFPTRDLHSLQITTH